MTGSTTAWSAPITAFGPYPRWELQAAMSALAGTQAVVSVNTWAFTSLSSLPGDGLTFTVSWTWVGGPSAGLFVFDSSSLTGTGATAALSVQQTGSLDRWFSPVPAEWLTVAADQSQVSVQTNGIRAVCATAAGGATNLASWLGAAYPGRSDCQLVYSASLVPTLTSVSATTGTVGTVLTLVGSGFDATAANDVVFFTPQFTAYASFPSCTVTSASATQLVCTVPALSAGQYRVSVQVLSAGYVDPASTPLYFTFTASYNTPNALVMTGSVAGGSLLVLTGAGFHVPASLAFMGNDSFIENATSYSAAGGDVVTIGGQACVLEDVTFSLLICRVPASLAATSAPVLINGQSVGTFLYSQAATPQVTSISPSQASAAITTVITITGTGFTVPAGYVSFFYAADTDNRYGFTAANHATLYDDSLFTQFAVHFGDAPCQVLTASATVITCQLLRSTPPDPSAIANNPAVYVMGLGYAQTQENRLTLALQVGSVAPQIGSINGGQYLTISGQGFVAQSTLEVTVDILAGKQLSDYSSMTTSSVGGGFHVMSAVNEVAREDRKHPMAAGHVDAHPQAQPSTAKSVLDTVMMQMHMRSSTQAHAVKQGRFATMSTSSFQWTGYSIPCAITSLTFTQIVCFTQPTGLIPANFSGTGYTSIVGIVHVNINEIPSVCTTSDPSQSCLYGFDTLHTPTVTAVSPTTGGANTALTISGTGLTGAVTVLVGYDTCAVTAQTATSITCTVPGNTASTVPVQVLFSDLGFASNTSLLTFTHTLGITSATPTLGSYAGGLQVTLAGSGFGALPADNVVTLNGLPAIVVSTSTTALVITTPPCPLSSADTLAVLELTVAGYYYASYRYPNVAAPSVYPVLGNDNAAIVSSSNTSAQLFSYTATLTSSVDTVSPQTGWAGQVITLTGAGLLAGTTVEIGGVACTPVTIASSTSISCTVGNTPAGTYPVNVVVPGRGLAFTPVASAATMQYTSQLVVSAISPLASGYGGGVPLTLTGQGFGTLPNQTVVSVCNTNCSITSSSYNQLVCTTDALSTLDRIHAYGPPMLSIAQGTTFGASDAAAAFDGDVQTYSASGTIIGLDVGASTLFALTRIRWYVRAGYASTSAGGQFQTSNDAQTWTTVASVTAYPLEGWNLVDIVDQTAGATVAPVTSAQRYFRFVQGPSGQPWMAEVEWTGYRVASLSAGLTGADVTQCPVAVTVVAQDPYESLQLNGAAYTNGYFLSTSHVAYSLAATPLVSGITPTNGSSLGGTSVTITGQGFGSAASTSVALQGYPCTVQSVTSSSIVCTSTSRLVAGLSSTGWQIDVLTGASGRALLVQQGGVSGVPLINPVLPLFRYLDRWSAKNTWAYDEPPLAGDTVIIPQGQTVLMDVSPPQLFVLLVQGVLVWDNQDGLGLDAEYIWINGGTFQLGTEQTPFPYRANITLHGDRSATELPYIGSKVLAVDGIGMGINGPGYAPYARWPVADQNGGARSDFYDNMDGIGLLDIHGLPRRRVWTKVTVGTYQAGATVLHTDEVVDFAAGERLALTDASTAANIEEVVVASLGSDGKTITLAAPLTLTHTSEWFSQSGYNVDMRCEIALLSRNVVVQGDDQSDYLQHGAHTMMMFGAVMRVENAEYRQCGQSFNLGRYCIHFHMAGDSHLAYAKSNSIHDGYQRAVTVHGVEYVNVWNNVAKDVKAHNFFVEDGGERENVFDQNLAINVRPLASLLQSDLEAAGFWTPTPSNIWRNNVVAKGEHAGWFFNAGAHPNGPSSTDSICTLTSPLLEFTNNSFHNLFFGVQIYPAMFSFADPCGAQFSNDEASFTTWPSTFNGLTSFRNFAGAGTKSLGDIQLSGLQFVDNSHNGLEWSLYDGAAQGRRPQVINSLFVGESSPSFQTQAQAIYLPQDEGVQVYNSTFINWYSTPALWTCDSCFTQAQQSQSGFTVRTSGLRFINSAQSIQFMFPFKDIIMDEDGSLTGVAGGTLTNNYSFNANPHCTQQGLQLGYGLLCDASVRVRKLAIEFPQPEALWGVSINVTGYDATTGRTIGSALLPYHEYDFSGWMIPVVTGYRYSVQWVDAAGDLLDFSSLVLRYSVPDVTAATTLGASNEWVQLSFPYTATRWQFEADYPGNGLVAPSAQTTLGGSVSVPWNNYTTATATSCLPTAAQAFGTGCNDAVHSVYTVVLNANINTALGTASQQVMLQALECPYTGCTGVITPPVVIPTAWSLWSDAATWASFNTTAPVAGSSVTIPPSAWVLFDLVGAPAYDLISIQGKLTFADTADLELIATRILVTGDFEIGNATAPHVHQATVTLVGSNTSPVLSVDNSQGSTIGNKVLAVFGNVSFYGTPVVNTWLPLAATATTGATSLTVSGSVADWAVGSVLVLSSTEYDTRQREQVTVTAVSGSTITFTPALKYRHFSGLVDYSATATVPLAAKVGLLTRNIIIRGQMAAADITGGWGGHIVVSEIPSATAHVRVPAGRLSLNYVQLTAMGQGWVTPAVLLHFFYGADNAAAYKSTYYATNGVSATAATATASSIAALTGCAFTGLYGQGIITQGAPNVVLASNVLDTPYAYGLKMDAASVSAVITGNLIVNSQRSPLDQAVQHSPIAAIYMLSFPLLFTNNVVAGANDSALTTYFPSCASPQTWSIEVHSAGTGVWQLPEIALACVQLSGITAWKISHVALYTTDGQANVWINNVVVADSHTATSIHNFAASSATVFVLNVTNSVFLGTTPASTCSGSLNCSGVAVMGDLLGTSSACNSAFGSGYRHVGLTTNGYYGRARTCLLKTDYGAAAECDPVNQFVFQCALPLENRYGLPDTVFASQTVHNVVFAYWTASECSGMKSSAIAFSPMSVDLAPEMQFSGITWYKSDNGAKISTALTAASGNCLVGCDAFDQFAMYDLDGSLLGGTAGQTVVTANSRVPTSNSACTFVPAWNAYQCSQAWRLLVVQGLASTSIDEAGNVIRMAPVQTTSLISSKSNVTLFSVGPIDDNCALETYTNFIPFLALANAQTYWVSTGTMVPNALLSVHSPLASERFLLTVFYEQPITVQVFVNSALGAQLTTRTPLLTDPVGTYTYDPQARLLYLVAGGGSQATQYTLITTALIGVTMSLAVDFATFDGVLLIQYMAQLLQIDPTTIKVVSVHSGSTVASYTIAGAANVTHNATANALFLNTVATNLVNAVQSGAFTAKTGLQVLTMTVTPPSTNGTAAAAATVSSPAPAPISAGAAAGVGVASGVVVGVVIAIVVALCLAAGAGGYVIRQRRLAAASKSVYSAKELELPEAKLTEKIAKRQPPPIVARRESTASTIGSSSQSGNPQPSPTFSSNVESRRESFATLNLDAPAVDDGVVYETLESYIPRFPQELEVRVGDSLSQVMQASDSWYVATNDRTGERGAVPRGLIAKAEKAPVKAPVKAPEKAKEVEPLPSPPRVSVSRKGDAPPPAQVSLSSSPPFPLGATSVYSSEIQHHTYVPTEDVMTNAAVLFPTAARGTVNLDRWGSLKPVKQDKEPKTPQEAEPSPSDEEAEEAKQEEKTNTTGVHRRVLSMEKRWKQ